MYRYHAHMQRMEILKYITGLESDIRQKAVTLSSIANNIVLPEVTQNVGYSYLMFHFI